MVFCEFRCLMKKLKMMMFVSLEEEEDGVL